MPRVPELNKALIAAKLEKEEQHAQSAAGMRAMARALRKRATQMLDGNDHEAMLRVAAGYEQRAKAITQDQ